ncbi:MAG: DUF262 domain-containing protein [Bryobacteraceae bacterium]
MPSSSPLQTSTASLGTLFSNARAYRIPLFQRHYSWGKEELEDLWEDLWDLHTGKDRTHFMGAIVLQSLSDTTFVVIDGQQRLTTLSLLGLAVIEAIERQAEDKNPARAAILRRLILGDEDPTSVTHIGRLTLGHNDDGFFRDFILPSIQPPNPQRLPESNRRLLDAQAVFRGKLATAFGPNPSGEELARFLNETVARRLQFIVITVEDDGDAYRFFETLNARGVSLSPADLIKNYLYSLAADSPAALEKTDRAWIRLTGLTGHEQFPEFLRLCLASQHGRIRREHLFRIIRKQAPDRAAALYLLQSLDASAELFAALREVGHQYWLGHLDDRLRVRALQIFRVTQFYPILFEAFARFSREDFSRVVKLAVVFTFRANVVGRQESSVLESTCAAAAIGIRNREITTLAGLAAALATIYVPDRQFLHDLEGLSFQTQGRDKRLARYVLFELEQDLGHATRDMDADPASIEHVLPENPGEEWNDAFPAVHIGNYIYRLGNLTLLEPNLNRQAATSPFPTKLLLYARSAYALTQTIQQQEWTPDTLTARQHQLAARAVHIWRSDFALTP